MNIDFEKLQSYTTRELEYAQKSLYRELRRRSEEERVLAAKRKAAQWETRFKLWVVK